MEKYFEQNNYSRYATGLFKFRPDSIRLMNWMVYYDLVFRKKKHFDSMAFYLKHLNDIS